MITKTIKIFDRFLLPLVLPLLLLVLWEFLTYKGVLRATILPAPSVISATLYDMVVSGELWGHLKISLWRVFQGFVSHQRTCSNPALAPLVAGISVVMPERFAIDEQVQGWIFLISSERPGLHLLCAIPCLKDLVQACFSLLAQLSRGDGFDAVRLFCFSTLNFLVSSFFQRYRNGDGCSFHLFAFDREGALHLFNDSLTD